MPYKLFVGKRSLWRSEPQVSIGQMQQHPSVLRPPCRFRMAVPMVSDGGWICRFDLVRHNNELATLQPYCSRDGPHSGLRWITPRDIDLRSEPVPFVPERDQCWLLGALRQSINDWIIVSRGPERKVPLNTFNVLLIAGVGKNPSLPRTDDERAVVILDVRHGRLGARNCDGEIVVVPPRAQYDSIVRVQRTRFRCGALCVISVSRSTPSASERMRRVGHCRRNHCRTGV